MDDRPDKIRCFPHCIVLGGLAPSLRHTSPAVAPALLTTIHHGERNIKYVVTLMVVILVAIVWRRWSDLIFVKKNP